MPDPVRGRSGRRNTSGRRRRSSNTNPRRSQGPKGRGGSSRSNSGGGSFLTRSLGTIKAGGDRSKNTREFFDALNPFLADPEKFQRYKDAANLRQLQQFAQGAPPDFGSMFNVNVLAPVLAPMPDRQNYIGPFQRAEVVAQHTYNQAQPVIQGIFGDLQQALAGRENEARQQGAESRQAAAREQQALRAQSTALTAPTALGESMGGTPGAEQQGEADRAFMALQAADQAQMQRDMEAATVGDSNARQADAEGMKAGSLANAQNNLESILGQIGIGRSQAERQYGQDVQQTNLSNAQAKQEHAVLKQQMQNDALQAQQQAEQLWAERNERAAAAAVTSGRQRWEKDMVARQERYPNGTAAMLDIIDAAGEGPTGRAQALRALSESFPGGRPSTVKDPETGDELYGGKRLNPTILRQWILDYYDEEERVDPAAYSIYGGDPTYLAVRDLYASR